MAIDRARLEQAGYVVVDLPLGAGSVDAARQEIERLAQLRAAEAPSRLGQVRPELPRLHQKSARLAWLVTDERLAALAAELLGGEVDVLWNQAHVKAPGGDARTAIPWHQDGHYVRLDPAPTYSCWLPLTPATVDNGALWGAPPPPGRPLLPHRWDEGLEYFRCDVDEASAFPVELGPGQALLFDTRWAHRSGVNRGAAARVAYSIAWCVAGARLLPNREPFGDRLPLVRGGRPVRALARAAATAEALWDALAARRAQPRARIEAEWARFVDACAVDPEGDAAQRAWQALMVPAEEDERVDGDLVRSRTIAAQALDEAARLLARGDERGARLLVARARALEPGCAVTHPQLRRWVERIDAGG